MFPGGTHAHRSDKPETIKYHNHSFMRLKTLMLTALAAGTLLTACQADDIPGPDAKELYTRDFIKKFGAFDPDHDWNMATQAGVTVTSARPADIKVYADVSGVRYLFGTFKGVTGTRTLNVDIPKGTGRLIVKANGRTHEVAPGASLTLDSRLMTDPGSTGDGILTWTHSRPRMFSTTGLNAYIDEVEGLYPEERVNLDKGHNSFYFVGDGKEHTFYPFYWESNKYHALGIYYIPDPASPEKIVMQDLYYTKTGELKIQDQAACNVEITEGTSFAAGDVHMYGAYEYTLDGWNREGVFPGLSLASGITLDNPEAEMHEWMVDGELLFPYDKICVFNESDAVLMTSHGYISRVRYRDNAFTLSETVLVPYSYPAGFSKPMSGFRDAVEFKAYSSTVNYIAASGITYSINPGILYGFYIKASEQVSSDGDGPFYTVTEEDGKKIYQPKPLAEQKYKFTVFSQASRNESYVDPEGRNDIIRTHDWSEKEWWEEGNYTNLDRYAYASWGKVEMGGKKYTAFGFEDWEAENNSTGPDLNDVVFLFETGLEPTNVRFEIPEPETPSFMWIIAAEDLGVTDFDFNDVVFGVTNPETDEATGEKTVDIVPLAAGGTLPIYVYYKAGQIGGEFHSWFEGTHASTTAINVGGYSAAPKKPVTISVDKDFTLAHCQGVKDSNMGGFTIKVEKQGSYEGNIITAPDISAGVTEAPQMICVGTNWYWPKEHVYIGIPYEGFGAWCTAPAECNDWHNGENVPDEHKDKIVKHNYAGTSGGDTPDPGPDNPDVPVAPTGDVLNPSAIRHPLYSADSWLIKYELSQEILTKMAEANSVKLKFYSTDKISNCEIGTTEYGKELFSNFGGQGLPSEISITATDFNAIWAKFYGGPEEDFNITATLVIE